MLVHITFHSDVKMPKISRIISPSQIQIRIPLANEFRKSQRSLKCAETSNNNQNQSIGKWSRQKITGVYKRKISDWNILTILRRRRLWYCEIMQKLRSDSTKLFIWEKTGGERMGLKQEAKNNAWQREVSGQIRRDGISAFVGSDLDEMAPLIRHFARKYPKVIICSTRYCWCCVDGWVDAMMEN